MVAYSYHMPEGPEVKRTTERLNRFLQGSKLQEIVVEDDGWFRIK